MFRRSLTLQSSGQKSTISRPKMVKSRTYIFKEATLFITINSRSIPVASSRYLCASGVGYFPKLKIYIVQSPPKVSYVSTELRSVKSQKPKVLIQFINRLFFCQFRPACWSSVQWAVVVEIVSLAGNDRPYFQIK